VRDPITVPGRVVLLQILDGQRQVGALDVEGATPKG